MSGPAPGFVHGYVLAGGLSLRMGRDKALLEWDGATLLRRAYDLLVSVCGAATVVGPAERYASLNLPLIADLRGGCGPLGGLEAALTDCVGKAEWAFMVACDMPALDASALEQLVEQSRLHSGSQAILPLSPSGREEPLCALYRPEALPVVRKQLDTGDFKLMHAIAALPVHRLQLDHPRHFLNINQPEDWEALHARR
ncbi:MAG: molybdenum cofactor guanylyltransferase [Acidobacteria bacterium]|nr:molybdenum cofactor guanylyltransferase [Acidobacteriota bacterium]